jgi:hypothetical protein
LRQRLVAEPDEKTLEVSQLFRRFFKSKVPERLPGAAREQALDAR